MTTTTEIINVQGWKHNLEHMFESLFNQLLQTLFSHNNLHNTHPPCIVRKANIYTSTQNNVHVLIWQREKNIIINSSINIINNHNHPLIIANDHLSTTDLIHTDIQVQLDNDIVNVITIMKTMRIKPKNLWYYTSPTTGKTTYRFMLWL